MTGPTSTDDLRGRLETLFSISSHGLTDKTLGIFADWLASEDAAQRAIEERMRFSERVLIRQSLAALAAALAPEGDGGGDG